MPRFGSGILLGVAAAEGMAHLVVPHGRRHVQRPVPRTLKPERKVEILRSERVEERVESPEPFEQVRPRHHGAAAGDARRSAVTLSAVDFSEPYRYRSAPP